MGDWKDIDPLMRGYKISVSFSCPSELIGAVEELARNKNWNRSQVLKKLVRLGITYTQLLEEQARLKEEEKVASKPKKKRKPKTPSK